MASRHNTSELETNQKNLLSVFTEFPSCLVAFSGGVDSAVVAKAASLVLRERAIAVTGVSASLASGELETARQVAQTIGILHQTVATDELSDPNYLQNEPHRCWHCKTELYSHLRQLGDRLGFDTIVNGTNADDLSDFRPGLLAAGQRQVRSPLAECGVGKSAVRQLAQHWELEVWDKPASPCLSSRVVYGLAITPERLARIDSAERFLKELGFPTVSVRCHSEELARLEVLPGEIARLAEPRLCTAIAGQLRSLGFRYVTIDMEGFRSGSFVQLVPSELVKGRSH